MTEPQAPDMGGKLDFLTRKVGPLPVWMWVMAGAGIWYFVSRKTAGSTAGTQTDPAGNVGIIDPATGYVYGSPQDQSTLAANNAGGGSTGTTTGTSGSTTGGQYADNNAWANAAINFLVARGIDPTQANEAVQQWLAGQQLTPQQQADVNLAIQGLGTGPPSPPGPSGVAPPPVVTPPPGTVYATNPPTGLTIASKTGNTVTLKWNAATNATGYTVSWGTDANASSGTTTVAAPATTGTADGLSPGTLYYLRVQATPAQAGAGFASITTSTTGAGGPAGALTAPAVRMGQQGNQVTVSWSHVPGAAKYHVWIHQLAETTVGSDTTTWSHAAAKGHDYTAQVQAVDAAGKFGPYSKPVTTHVPA